MDIEKLNRDIERFPQVHPITPDMAKGFEGVSRLVMLDRYSFKDTEKKTLSVGDLVLLTVKPDPTFPARGIGTVEIINSPKNEVTVKLTDEYQAVAGSERMTVGIDTIEKPLEIFYEQIARRVATGLASVEEDENKQAQAFEDFYEELSSLNFVPAGRVLYGAGSETDVTFFNCYVMPFPKDSREGIGEHRNEVMEIMSRGGGVGTNGSTLRPRNALARGVNGKSSGAVSWLNDIASLTHLVEQGGSRRGAQMIMLADWHPDIIEFIISKMQNPNILRHLINTTEDEQIKRLAQEKLKFEPLSVEEKASMEILEDVLKENEDEIANEYVSKLLADGGRYSVHNPDFLTGANISVAITDEFMQAVENDEDYELRFPDVENYNEQDMATYNASWHGYGDVREWEATGMTVKTYRTIKARELWNLINVCATYSAEPGVFFIDTANDMTNAQAYGQKVVATNPCGEQPLAPYSVCNLAAINLANMADKENKTVDYDKLKKTVRTGVRLMDNVIDATPYFLEENRKQALGERRLGLGVMGLHDLLIYCGEVYGSESANKLVDEVFKTIATTAYRTSIELAKEKGSFPFLESRIPLPDFDNDKHTAERRRNFISSGYMARMPRDIREGILKHGIRNSHLLTVAPTGSTGTMVGVSTGLEPYFAFKYFRSGRLGEFIEVNADIVEEIGVDPNNLPPEFVSAMELEPEAHADVQTTIQRWVDSSISKTVNAPEGYSVENVQRIYERLYDGGAKGGTVYVDGSRDSQVLSLGKDDKQPDDESKVKETNEVGTSVGDICPICRDGRVMEQGGCNTCDTCGTQLECGI